MKQYLIIAVALGLFAAACSSNHANDKRSELEKLKKEQAELNAKINALERELALTDSTAVKTRLVEIVELQPQPFNHFVDIHGKVYADQNISISAQVPGAVSAVYVREGDVVRPGQVLAEIDDRVVRQGVEEVKTQLMLAQQLFTKQENLWKQNIGSEVQFLQAKTQKEALERKMETMNEQLSMYRLTAPISGTVDEVTVKLGQVVAPGVPAFRVVNLSRLKATAEVPERFAGTIREGSDAVVFFPDLNKEVNSKVTFRSKAINNLNRTFTVHVDIDEAQGSFSPNQIAVVKITDYRNPTALVVPVNTVQRSESGEFIYVAQSSGNRTVARRVNVTTGQSYNGLVEITDGLNAGDRIITTGYDDLHEGAQLQIAN